MTLPAVVHGWGNPIAGPASPAPSSFGLPAELAELADEYELLGEIGRGGTAIVYRACDRTLGRDVAIKVVHPRPTSPDDDPVARLAREARTVAQLQHPGIVTVYAVRRLRSGGLALVMQLVPGATLKESIQRGGPFGPQRAEEILRDVAQALAYAHAHHVVHRDVKPENIFLHAESGRALLSDFGIARSTEADSMTATGTAIGTPFYMSPEQVDGLAVDGRSDLYSLGLVAWETLTGLRPWDGESLYHVIYKQKHEELPPIEALRRDVPRRLQYIVERMLQKRPAGRWAGADGLLVQLERSILPADYAQWQAALPARVARYRAVAQLQRPATPRPADSSAPAAPTVRFERLADPSLGTADGVDRSAGPGSTTASQTPDPLLPDRGAAAETEAGDTRPPGEPAILPEPSPTAPVSLTYDSVDPEWVVEEAPAPPTSRSTIRRRIVGGVVAGGAILSSIAAFHPWNIAPVRGLPSMSVLPALAGRSLSSHAVGGAGPDGGTGLPTRPRAVLDRGGAGGETDADLAEVVAVGTRHVCAVLFSGAAQCWGANADGQLGDGTTVPSSPARATPVLGIMSYAVLSAGGAHTCGVTPHGDVYCWGANDRGQLGDGTLVTRSAPVRIGSEAIYRDVRAGAAHTCGLDVSGAVYCWGDNQDGQLGERPGAPGMAAVRVPLEAGARATAVTAGAHHSCAIVGDDRVACWGRNAEGQLGRPVSDTTPWRPLVVPGVRATMVAAGDAHTCAVQVDAAVRCWGRRSGGVSSTGDVGPGRTVTIPGGEDLRSLVVGTGHACALTLGGWVWCWGLSQNDVGRMPRRVGQGPYVSIAAGADRTCAAARSRVPECWSGRFPYLPIGRTGPRPVRGRRSSV